MQTVILAGGLGTRLRPLTHDVPKPMVPIGGKPYLERQLAYLAGQGFTDILLLTGYLGEQVEAHFGDGSGFGVRVRYSREETPVGTGGALLQARPLLEDRFLLLYGDSFLPIEYREVMDLLSTPSPARLVLTAYDNRGEDTSVANNLLVESTGRISAYEKGTGNPQLNFVEAGVVGMRKDVLEVLPEAPPASLENQAFPRIIAQGEAVAYITRQRFYDFGTPERLAQTEAYFETFSGQA